jgi:hypothetical protein
LDELTVTDTTVLYGGTILVQPRGNYKNKLIIELAAYDEEGFQGVMWPYLEVPGTQENVNKIQIDQFNRETEKVAFQTDLNNGPRILVGGYWDTKFDTGNPINTLKMKVQVTHPEGLSSIDSVAFVYANQMTAFTFSDDGTNGDIQGGDGFYSISLDLADYPEPGYYILTVIAKDIYGNMSNTFPYLHIAQ